MKKNTNESNLIRRSHGVRPTPSPKGRLYNREGNRRGFTIVELVVTLTIIVLVSAISIGVVAVNNKTYGETIDMIEATNIAENAVECFRFAKNTTDNEADFKLAFENAFAKTHENGQCPAPVTENNTLVYTVVKDDVSVVISIVDNFKTIEIHAHSETDANLLEPITYTVR